MKAVGRFLVVGVLAMSIFSGVVHAGNTAGVFQLPFDVNQRWKYANGTNCPDVGYKSPADQTFMELNTSFAKYHLAEDWNGKCGGSTDIGGLLFASADGTVQDLDGKTDCSDKIGKILIIRYTLPDGTYRDHVYDHIQSILVRVGDPVTKGQQVATLGDGNGCYTGAAHFHEEMRRNNSGLTRAQNPYYQPLPVQAALKYTSPSLFIDDRRNAVVQNLVQNQWAIFAQNTNAPSSTAFIEYNGERYSLQRAVQSGYIHAWVLVQINGTWYYYPDITSFFFSAGYNFAMQALVPGATLTILIPGHNFKEDRAKIDMLHAVPANSNFRNVKPDDFKLYTSDQSFDYWYMRFTDDGGGQPVYANQATLKSNPLVRYTAYYDPATGSWTAWTQVNLNTLD